MLLDEPKPKVGAAVEAAAPKAGVPKLKDMASNYVLIDSNYQKLREKLNKVKESSICEGLEIFSTVQIFENHKIFLFFLHGKIF